MARFTNRIYLLILSNSKEKGNQLRKLYFESVSEKCAGSLLVSLYLCKSLSLSACMYVFCMVNWLWVSFIMYSRKLYYESNVIRWKITNTCYSILYKRDIGRIGERRVRMRKKYESIKTTTLTAC